MGLSCRASLLQPTGAGSGSAAGRETLRTAELDNRGLVQLQHTVMREQDSELEELERSVISTKVSCPKAWIFCMPHTVDARKNSVEEGSLGSKKLTISFKVGAR